MNRGGHHQQQQQQQPGEILTSAKLGTRALTRLASIGLLIFYWYAISASVSQSSNVFFSLLLSSSVFDSITTASDSAQTLSQYAWYISHGEGFCPSVDLPGRKLLSSLSLFGSLAKLGKFIVVCWITNKVFPTWPCIDDGVEFTGIGCSAVHVISIVFVIMLCLIALMSFVTFFTLFLLLLTGRQGSLRNQSSGAIGSMIPTAIRQQILSRLPETDEPPKNDVCAICLELGEPNSKWRLLPCSHQFHTTCVDEYLQSNGVCPLCRQDPANPPPAAARPQPGSDDNDNNDNSNGQEQQDASIQLRTIRVDPQHEEDEDSTATNSNNNNNNNNNNDDHRNGNDDGARLHAEPQPSAASLSPPSSTTPPPTTTTTITTTTNNNNNDIRNSNSSHDDDPNSNSANSVSESQVLFPYNIHEDEGEHKALLH